MKSSKGRRIIRFSVLGLGIYGILLCAIPVCVANPLWPWETVISPWSDRVEIIVNREGNNLMAATVCDAELRVYYSDPEPSDNVPDATPTLIDMLFPLPPESENILVTVNDKTIEVNEPGPIPEEFESLFPGYETLQWTMPPYEGDHVANVHVEYTHRLPQENGGWRLDYAFGSGDVNISSYNIVYLRIILLMPLSPSEVISLNELVFNHQVEDERTILTFGEAYDYAPYNNASLLIKPESQSTASLWELY